MNLIISSILAIFSCNVHAFTPSISSPNKIRSSSGITLEASNQEQLEEEQSRRSFLTRSIFATSLIASSGFLDVASNPANAFSSLNYQVVSADIADLIKEDPNRGPTLVRLAWHSSGTYDKMTKTGGSGKGTIRFKEELEHPANAGLEITAVAWLEPIKQKYGDALSYADLYTLGGVTAIKALSGPTIPWRSGRKDTLDPSDVTPNGRLPNADSGPPGADPSDAAHLRTIFNRMGFNDQEIVALSGAHALGRCHTDFSGFEGPWTPLPTTMNNLYFRLLNEMEWTKRDWDGPFQYKNDRDTLMMLPTDFVLIKDENFKRYVDIYAGDQDRFFKDFSAAFQKLEELGTGKLSKANWA